MRLKKIKALSVLSVLLLAVQAPWALAAQDIVQTLAQQCEEDALLRDVLAREEKKGSPFIYSERLIQADMRAPGRPAGSADEQLKAWLALYGLNIVNTARGDRLIARSSAPPFIVGKVLNAEGRGVSHASLKIPGVKENVRSSVSGCFYIFGNPVPSKAEGISVQARDSSALAALRVADNWWTIQLSAVEAPALESVLVMGSSHQIMRNDLSPDNFLGREEIERFPHLGDDITRVFRHLPGTASGDISPKINVRGGEKRELAMVLDGLELRQPWYFKSLDGLVSIVDSNIIASADVLSGGYTAEYGGKGSAIIDITTLDAHEVKNRVGLSFITAFAQTAQPFSNANGGYYASLRGGYLDLVFKMAGSEANIEPRYGDLFSKANFDLNDNHRLSINVLLASDGLQVDDTLQNGSREYVGDDSSNNNIWLSLKSDISTDLQVNHSLYFSDLHHNMQAYYDNPIVFWQDKRRYQALGFKSAWTASPHRQHFFKWGIDVKELKAAYDYFLSVQVEPRHSNTMHLNDAFREENIEAEGQEHSAYLAWRFRPFDKLFTEVGGRWEKQHYNQLDEGLLFSPRFNAVYDVFDKSSINISWGKFRQAQGIDELSPGDNDTVFHPSLLVEHRIVGFKHTLSDSLDLRLDLYQKNYSQLIPRYENLYKDIARVVNEAADDRIRIAPERSVAEGVELGLTYTDHAHFSAWLNYSQGTARDFIEDREVPRSWDQRQAFNIGLDWDYGEWSFNVSGMMRSGWPTTPSVIESQQGGRAVVKPDFENYNSERLEGYSRLDVRLSRKHVYANGNYFQYYLEVYNLFNTKNPCCTNYQLESSEGEAESRAVPKFDNWMPFLPSFGVQYIF